MLRAEVGSRCQQYNVTGFNHILIAIEPHKAVRIINVDAGRLSVFVELTGQSSSRTFENIRECVGHGYQLSALIRRQCLCGSPGSTTSTANQADFQQITATCMQSARKVDGAAMARAPAAVVARNDLRFVLEGVSLVIIIALSVGRICRWDASSASGDRRHLSCTE